MRVRSAMTAARSPLKREGGQRECPSYEEDAQHAEVGVVAHDGELLSRAPADDRGARKADRHGGEDLLSPVERACEPQREHQRDDRNELKARALAERRRIDEGHAGLPNGERHSD